MKKILKENKPNICLSFTKPFKTHLGSFINKSSVTQMEDKREEPNCNLLRSRNNQIHEMLKYGRYSPASHPLQLSNEKQESWK